VPIICLSAQDEPWNAYQRLKKKSNQFFSAWPLFWERSVWWVFFFRQKSGFLFGLPVLIIFLVLKLKSIVTSAPLFLATNALFDIFHAIVGLLWQIAKCIITFWYNIAGAISALYLWYYGTIFPTCSILIWREALDCIRAVVSGIFR